MDLNEYCTWAVTLWIYLDAFKWNKDCAAMLTEIYIYFFNKWDY